MKKIGIKLLVSASLCFMLSGCLTQTMSHKQLTSLSVIGCETDDVQVSGETYELNGTENWTAKCGGKTYYCTYLNESSLNCYEITE